MEGRGGKGVTANIRNREQLLLAIKEADSPRGFLIEKNVPGEDFRFLVAGEKVLGVWKRDAANVIGDGQTTLDALIDQKNEIRNLNPHLASRPIKKDNLVINHLKKSGLNLDHIPKLDEKVYLRSAANLSSGGDNVEITDETHDSLKEIAVQAKKVIPGIELVGVDLLLEDYSLPATSQDVNVCEINSMPGISAHDFPMYGPPRVVAREYLELLMERSGLVPGAYSETGEFKLTVFGNFIDQGHLEQMRVHAKRANLEVVESHQTSRQVNMTVSGQPMGAAVLDALSLHPRPVYGRAEASTISRIG